MLFSFFMGVAATLAVEFLIAHGLNYLNKQEVAKANAVLAAAAGKVRVDASSLITKIEKVVDDEVQKAEIFLHLKNAGIPVPAANAAPVAPTPTPVPNTSPTSDISGLAVTVS